MFLIVSKSVHPSVHHPSSLLARLTKLRQGRGANEGRSSSLHKKKQEHKRAEKEKHPVLTASTRKVVTLWTTGDAPELGSGTIVSKGYSSHVT